MNATYAGIELGGTKTIVVRGRPGVIRDRVEFPTTAPEHTLARAVETIAQWHQLEPLKAIGVASFGPIRVSREAPDFGMMLDTPKPGWTGVSVIGPIVQALGLPVALDTDVHGAGLAERFVAVADEVHRRGHLLSQAELADGAGGGAQASPAVGGAKISTPVQHASELLLWSARVSEAHLVGVKRLLHRRPCPLARNL